jgi:hypothetical protein
MISIFSRYDARDASAIGYCCKMIEHAFCQDLQKDMLMLTRLAMALLFEKLMLSTYDK